LTRLPAKRTPLIPATTPDTNQINLLIIGLS